MSVAFFKGDFIDESAIVIGIKNRSFAYGDGLFETLRCCLGKPLFANLHLKRMETGLEILKLKLPDNYKPEFILELIKTLLEKNSLHNGSRIRIHIYRNAGGFYRPEANTADILITSVAIEENKYAFIKKGLTIGLYTEIKKPVNKFSIFKSCNSLLYVMASVYAAEKKLDDAIIVNEKNLVCESSNSNIFIVKNNLLITPPLTDGCIDGVMRHIVIDLASQRGLQVAVQSIAIDELKNADEIFLTNAGSAIRPVTNFENTNYQTIFSERCLAGLLN